jgi:hypothetical protein
LLCSILALAALSSCSARFSVKLQGAEGASVDLDASLGPRTATLIANLAGASGAGSSGAPVLDAASLTASLRTVPGIASAALRNTDKRTVAGSVSVAELDRFLSPRFARLERSASGGRVSFYLDRASAPAVLSSISPELLDYLTALMAPAATGEAMAAAEYLSVVASVYGEGVAEELRAGRLRASVELPGPARSSRGGTVSGTRVDFTVPVVDLLVLEKPIELDAAW